MANGYSKWVDKDALDVKNKVKAPRNVVKDPSPLIKKGWLKDVSSVIPHKITTYLSTENWKGTFYRECESAHLYHNEKFLRIVMFDSDCKDIETRIPLSVLEELGFGLPSFSMGEVDRLAETHEEISDLIEVRCWCIGIRGYAVRTVHERGSKGCTYTSNGRYKGDPISGPSDAVLRNFGGNR